VAWTPQGFSKFGLGHGALHAIAERP
jgi:hypothetical protein